LEADFSGNGTREFIKVMRLLKTHSIVAAKRVAQPGLEINIASSEAHSPGAIYVLLWTVLARGNRPM